VEVTTGQNAGFLETDFDNTEKRAFCLYTVRNRHAGKSYSRTNLDNVTENSMK
jgi:hypothetical protein